MTFIMNPYILGSGPPAQGPPNFPFLNFNDATVAGYAGGQDLGTSTLEDGGTTILLSSNAWKKATFAQPFYVQADTILEFEVNGSDSIEIASIGFDTDEVFDNDTPLRQFQISGSDVFANAHQTYNNYVLGSGWQSYSIPIGTILDPGQYTFITFIADDDVNEDPTDFRWRNVRVYTPTVSDISGLRLWLDAAELGTISDTAGLVDQWDDKSGYAYNVTSTASNRPTTGTRTQNNLNVFDMELGEYMERSDALGFTGNPDITVFVVCTLPSISTSQCSLYLGDTAGTGGNVVSYYENDGSFRFNNGNLIHNSPGAGSLSFTMYERIAGDTYNQGSFYRNNSQVASTGQTNGSNTPNILNERTLVGNHAFSGSVQSGLRGYLCELIVYDKILNPTERLDVYTYLFDKWNSI